ncbi:MAG: hypothetical protein ABH814_03345 [bacterium]
MNLPRMFKQKRYLLGALFLILLVIVFSFLLSGSHKKSTSLNTTESYSESEPPTAGGSIKMTAVTVKDVIDQRNFWVTNGDGTNFNLELTPEGRLNYILDQDANLPVEAGDILLIDLQVKAIEGGNLIVERIVVSPKTKK